MRAICGINANKVASELGTQIRWICPIQGFYSSWNNVSDEHKRAVLQAVRDKFKVTENDVEGTELVEQVFNEKANLLYKDWKWRMNDFYTKTVDARLDAYQHPFQGMHIDDWKYMIDHVFKDPKREGRKRAGKKKRERVPYGHTTGSRSFAAVMTIAADREKQRIANEGNDDDGNGNEPNSNEGNEETKKLDLCDLFEASHRLRDTNEWINSTCQGKHCRTKRDANAIVIAKRNHLSAFLRPVKTILGYDTEQN
ncbi:hypothetical protein RHMOL_Rhmol05G0292800 [Rhododendron molle]|uniref:Uncharacterized protein n=1 Tax=Rhododendron molle TaxID=49168 RepID=A0ACC0NV99_RHOML|nr:hypothetical protein RHMOL_Rhmol05G0292800 [Rhododendron molle]